MRRLLFISIFMFSTIFTSIATSNGVYPDWILPDLRKYPIETYLFDVGRSNIENKEEAYKEAIAKAHRKIAEKILRKVDIIIRINRNNPEHYLVQEHYSTVLEDYCTRRQANPALKIKNLLKRNLSVEAARPERDTETFALVYITRDRLREIYANHALNLQNEIRDKLNIAQAAERALNINTAVRSYLQTYPLYEALKEAEIIQIGAEFNPNFENSFRRLARAATENRENLWSHRMVIKRVEELQGTVIVNYNDIFKSVINQLVVQTTNPNGSVLVQPLIYQDSEMISPITLQFTQAMREGLPWAIVDSARQFNQNTIGNYEISRERPKWRLSPSFWINGEEITIRATLRNVTNGDFLASAIVKVMQTQLRESHPYRPRGYERAQREKEAFNPRYFIRETSRGNDETLVEHAFSPVGGLKVDVRTGEGNSDLSYTEGDTVKIFARVNQPAHIRLLYTLADQRRTLLVNNFHIDKDKVNDFVEIGTFRCAPPFGVEFLNVLAQTERFTDIETHEEDGYFFLVEQNPEKASSQYRGLQRISKEKNEKMLIGPKPILEKQPDFQQVGAQLVFTVEKKKD